MPTPESTDICREVEFGASDFPGTHRGHPHPGDAGSIPISPFTESPSLLSSVSMGAELGKRFCVLHSLIWTLFPRKAFLFGLIFISRTDLSKHTSFNLSFFRLGIWYTSLDILAFPLCCHLPASWDNNNGIPLLGSSPGEVGAQKLQ